MPTVSYSVDDVIGRRHGYQASVDHRRRLPGQPRPPDIFLFQFDANNQITALTIRP